MNSKLKVLFVSPWPPQVTGVGEYAFDMLQGLRNFDDFDITVLTNSLNPTQLEGIKFKQDPDGVDFKQYLIIHQLGNNSEFHLTNFTVLKEYGGIVQLHDPVLHDILKFMILSSATSENNVSALLRTTVKIAKSNKNLFNLLKKISLIKRMYHQLYNKHLAKPLYRDLYVLFRKWYGDRLSLIEYDITSNIQSNLGVFWNSRLIVEYPLFEEALQYADAVIVHSKQVKRQVKHKFKDLDITQFNLCYGGQQPRKKTQSRVKSRIGIFGHYDPFRHYEKVIVAFSTLLNIKDEFELCIVGKGDFNHLKYVVRQHGLQDKVKFIVNQELNTFDRLLEEMDLLIQLRDPTRGESSAVVAKALQMGLCCIISDHGWYAELPEFLPKVPVAPTTATGVFNALYEVFFDSKLSIWDREQLIKEYALSHYNYDKAVRLYADFIRARAAQREIN